MQRNVLLAFVFVLVLGTFARMAHADLQGIYVEFYSELNPNDGWAAVPGFPNRHAQPVAENGLVSGSNITITNANITPYRIFAVNPTTTDIGDIEISSGGVVTYTLFIGQGQTVPLETQPLSSAGGRNIGDIDFGSGRLILQAKAETAFVGDVRATQIVRLDAPTISGGVFNNPSSENPGPRLGRVQTETLSGQVLSNRGDIGTVFASTQVSGQISTLHGNIETVIVGTGSVGDLKNSVLSPDGAIGTITVAGSIRSPADPNNRVIIRAKSGISSITAGSIYADITANYNGGTGNLRILNTTSTTDGDVVGTIGCANVTSNPAVNAMDIKGDFHASLTATGVINRAIVIRRAFTGNITAGSPTVGGIVNTIYINAANLGNTWGSNADIHHHGPNTALAPRRHYLQSTNTIGLGSVAEVPYHYHPIDCEPDDDAVITDIGQIPTTVTMHWYGAVTTWIPGVPTGRHYVPANEWPLRVYERNIKVIGGQPIDVSNRFLVTILNSISRAVTIQARPGQTGFRIGYEYSFRPVQADSSEAPPLFRRMICHDVIDGPSVTTVPNPAAYDNTADPYSFQIPVVTLDLNQSGEVDPADAAAWLDNPIDVNADQSADTLDLEEIIDAIE